MLLSEIDKSLAAEEAKRKAARDIKISAIDAAPWMEALRNHIDAVVSASEYPDLKWREGLEESYGVDVGREEWRREGIAWFNIRLNIDGLIPIDVVANSIPMRDVKAPTPYERFSIRISAGSFNAECSAQYFNDAIREARRQYHIEKYDASVELIVNHNEEIYREISHLFGQEREIYELTYCLGNDEVTEWARYVSIEREWCDLIDGTHIALNCPFIAKKVRRAAREIPYASGVFRLFVKNYIPEFPGTTAIYCWQGEEEEVEKAIKEAPWNLDWPQLTFGEPTEEAEDGRA